MTKPESGWNYRIMLENGEFRLVEAHYNNGEIYAYSEPFAVAGCESLQELTDALEAMMKATFKPVIAPGNVTGKAPWEDNPDDFIEVTMGKLPQPE